MGEGQRGDSSVLRQVVHGPDLSEGGTFAECYGTVGVPTDEYIAVPMHGHASDARRHHIRGE
jgi:hypothetical protein